MMKAALNNKSRLASQLNCARSSQGFSLIETLVASILLVIGILSFLALQLESMKSTQLAGEQTQAAVLASDIINSARANLKGLEAGSYNLSLGKAADKSSTIVACSPCSPSDLAQQDVAQWVARIASELNDATVKLNYSAPEFSVRIEWPSARAEEAPFIYETMLRICAQENLSGGTPPCLI